MPHACVCVLRFVLTSCQLITIHLSIEFLLSLPSTWLTAVLHLPQTKQTRAARHPQLQLIDSIQWKRLFLPLGCSALVVEISRDLAIALANSTYIYHFIFRKCRAVDESHELIMNVCCWDFLNRSCCSSRFERREKERKNDPRHDTAQSNTMHHFLPIVLISMSMRPIDIEKKQNVEKGKHMSNVVDVKRFKHLSSLKSLFCFCFLFELSPSAFYWQQKAFIDIKIISILESKALQKGRESLTCEREQ